MKFLLIDGNSLINRSFYAIRLLSNKNGVYTNAVTGFLNALLRLRNTVQPDYIAVAFDMRAPTFRHEMYTGYKSKRKGMPDELAVQLPYIKEILDYMGITRVESEGWEADDIIGTLSQLTSSVIATGDRDAFQLISEQVSVRLASTKEEITYTPEKIREVYGIEPVQMLEVKALMGDSSDEIPGVTGIGEKTAFTLIQKFGSIEYIYNNLDNIDTTASVKAKLIKDKDMAFLSRKLGTIALDAPVSLNLDDYKITDGYPVELARLLTELEMASFMKKIGVEPVAIETPQIADSPRIIEIEALLEPILRDMEKTGIKVDKAGISDYGEELQAGIIEAEKQIYALAGETFNISSPKQLGEILFDKLGLPGSKKTKTGYSTNSDVLESLSDKHEIIPLITEFRALSKLNSTYVQGLLKAVSDKGRVHTTFKNETQTGRLSSIEPNIQNIPVRTERGRVMRRFFIAEKGNLLVDADYSQIELRVLAFISGDEVMLEAFRNGNDIHTITASQVFGVSEKTVTRDMRTAAKAVNFGIVYGMGAFSLSKEIDVSVGEANYYINRYLEKYSGVRDYLERTVTEAKSNGYVKTLLGRVRYVPEITSSNKIILAAGERIVKNTPIQGTAADIIKIAMIRVYNRLQAELPEAKLILQVHDELIIEAPSAVSETAAVIVKEEMIEAGRELGIELVVDVKTGKSWYETH
ncbi:MAG: DNA polymerase I [Oscillospiraceae bacterium]|nr:DNA polymerase I [Oscillospiraceae bacterium]